MPVNEKIALLGRSKGAAIKHFLSTERKMQRNSDFGYHYRNFMAEFENQKHMSPITNDNGEGYYTPHHGVVSAEKFRTVFNSSYPTSSGISLNDCQLTGPKLQVDLPVILNRFRSFQFALTADIVKMYRQIEIHQKDRKYQKFGEMLRTKNFGSMKSTELRMDKLPHLFWRFAR